MGNFVSGRKKGETPKSSFYFSFRPLTKFPIADLGVWRSGSGRRATFEQVQLCVHSRKIAFFVNLQNPDLLSPGPANVGQISPGSAGHSLITLSIRWSLRECSDAAPLLEAPLFEADARGRCEHLLGGDGGLP